MICIEVAHIYANETINENHLQSINIAKNLKNNNEIRFVCLIDNYHATGDVLALEQELSFHNDSISFFYEAHLVELADQFFHDFPLMEKKFKNKTVFFLGEISIYEKNDHKIKYYCSSLCVVWYLLRLGYFNNEKIDKIINILPKKFMENEKKVIDIIAQINYHDFINRIEYIWY